MNTISLDSIALRHGTDKSSTHHNYTKVYEQYFDPVRDAVFVLLELGTGAYWKKDDGFQGAKTWADYFRNALIVTIDIHDKDLPASHPQIQFFKGSQDDKVFLDGVIEKVSRPSIIIDDASHINSLTIKSFIHLFGHLKPGGIYCVEDVESSWWQDIASDGTDFGGCKEQNDLHANTTVNWFRLLVNDVNRKSLPNGVYYPIESIHFHKNMIVIKKEE
jgi:hypothetical protein